MSIFLRLPKTSVCSQFPKLQPLRLKCKRPKKKKPPPPVDGMPGLYSSMGQRWFSENHNLFEKKMIMKMKEIWPLIFCAFFKVFLLSATIIRHTYTRDDVRWCPKGTFVCERYDDIVNDRPPKYRKLLNINQKVEWPAGLKEACEALDPDNETDATKLSKTKKTAPKKGAKPPCDS